MRSSSIARLLAPALLATVLAVPGHAENAEIAKRRAAERKQFTDKQIIDGFFKVSFGAEMGLDGPSDRIRKFDRPVRVFIEGRVKPDRTAAIGDIVADIRDRIANLDIAIVRDRAEANYIVRLVRNRDLPKTVRELYGKKGDSIIRSLDPQCLSGIKRDKDFRIVQADVILVADVGEFTFYDCAFEELLQALGPIRDDASVRWTMFNDEVRMGFFGVYDQYILNILYDHRIVPGMTRAQVRALLPEVLPTARAFVEQKNGLSH